MRNEMKRNDDELLRLDIQYFSEEDGEEKDDIEPEADVVGEGKEGEVEPKEKPEFTQADVDRIVNQRLARERKKRQEEQEQEEKKEQGKYKELYEETQQELAQIKRNAILESSMLKAGYSESQIEKYGKYIEGEDESEISESILALAEDIVPEAKKGNQIEPSPYPAGSKQPKAKEGTDYGKQAYERIKKRK